MASGGAIYNIPQCYGNGTVLLQGSFIDTSTVALVAHGKGFTVARTATGGCYKLVLQAAVLDFLAADAGMTVPNSIGVGSFSHPGFAQCGDLQTTDSKTFYIYTYTLAGTQTNLDKTSICDFSIMASISALNP